MKEAAKIVEDSKKYGNPNIVNSIENTTTLNLKDTVNRVAKDLASKGIPTKVADDIIVKALVIDDAIGNNQMIKIIDDLLSSGKLNNPADLAKNLGGLVDKAGKIDKNNAINFIKELEEGKYWINQGEEVIVSKNLSKGGNEVDVLIPNKNAIVEVKHVSGANTLSVTQRLDDILNKFIIESKLSTSIKSQYPNHLGKLEITNSLNPLYNLSKQEIIEFCRKSVINQPGGINKTKLINSISELHIQNNKGRFVIKSNEW